MRDRWSNGGDQGLDAKDSLKLGADEEGVAAPRAENGL